MMTLEERECRAYIDGNTTLAAAYALALQAIDDLIEEQGEEIEMLRKNVDRLEDQLDRIELEGE